MGAKVSRGVFVGKMEKTVLRPGDCGQFVLTLELLAIW